MGVLPLAPCIKRWAGWNVEKIEKLPKATTTSSVGTVQGTAEVAMILERAKKEADKMGDEYISTEHILLSLIGIKSHAQEILITS